MGGVDLTGIYRWCSFKLMTFDVESTSIGDLGCD